MQQRKDWPEPDERVAPYPALLTAQRVERAEPPDAAAQQRPVRAQRGEPTLQGQPLEHWTLPEQALQEQTEEAPLQAEAQSLPSRLQPWPLPPPLLL
ncbi:MAG TPA: hypothetical protein VMU43_10685 [Candidatus Acidoferrum sp.]|nr:hypothetical protein [Candidatus Acidoferrum sp.]